MMKDINHLIQSKKYPPVLLLFGEEDFLLDETFDRIIDSLLPDKNLSYDADLLDGDSTTFLEVVSKCGSYPFIAEKRIVGIRHFDALLSKESAKKNIDRNPFIKYLESPQSTTFLLLTVPAALKSSKPAAKTKKSQDLAALVYNIIFEKFEYVEFPKIYESEYSAWANKRIKSKGKEISPEACELLVSQTAQSLRALNNEIEKLLVYLENKEHITMDDITHIVGVSRVYNVFELQKAIGRRNIAKTFEILENMLAADRQEMLIITMLTRYFIVLWKLIEESLKTTNNFQLAKEIGVNPYFVPEYLEAAKLYSPSEIDRAFKALTEADEQLKTSAKNTLYILEAMLLKIMSK